MNRRNFVKAVTAASLGSFLAAGSTAGSSDGTAIVTVHTNQHIGSIDPRIFGYMTEETLTSYAGGISSEMLFNRKFEILEKRDISKGIEGIEFKGTGGGWEPLGLSNGITLVQDEQVYYSASRSQRIMFAGGDVPAGVQQRGYQHALPQFPIVPRLRIENPFDFRPGERYRVRLAIKNRDLRGSVYVALGESYSKPIAQHAFEFSGGEDWEVYECVLTPKTETSDGKFMVYINSPGTIWIDSASLVRVDLDDDGFRKDALELTRRLKPTCIRWPGGLFVSDYHWMDGIGPRDKRPARLNRSWMAYTTNDVGIDEFVELCRKLNAEPYACVNVGTGSAEEAAALVEYANGAPNTKHGRLRAANGHPEPYRIKAWNVGNEEYNPLLGSTCGSVYGKTFVAYAKAMRAVDPSIELVADGALVEPPKELLDRLPPDDPAREISRYRFNWNEEVLPIAGGDISYFSIHDYAPETVKGLNAQELNRAAMVKAENLNAKLDHLYQLMEEYVPGGRHIPIALDEWAVFLPHDAPPDASIKPPAGIKKPFEIGLYGSAETLRDAVGGAAVYNLMQRRPKEFAIGNRTILYAYIAGMIGIGRDRVVASPPALSLELYSTYDHCQALKVEAAGPTFDVAPNGSYAGAKGANLIDASARLGSDGTTLEVFLVNRSLEENIDTAVRLSGGQPHSPVDLATLNGPSLVEWNSFEEPDRVKIENSQIALNQGTLQISLPAHSISKLTMSLLKNVKFSESA
jgi:alpha-L-arabinofuranosidase